MPVYQDEQRGTWYVKCRYKDWNKKFQNKTKRGFATKEEALEWEQDFKKTYAYTDSITFQALVEIYKEKEYPKLSNSTLDIKQNTMNKQILPYFQDMKIRQLDDKCLEKWIQYLTDYKDRKGKPYSAAYIRKLYYELLAILNFAKKEGFIQYVPSVNSPVLITNTEQEIAYWTLQEYQKFSSTLKHKKDYYLFFQLLYWLGLTEGEAISLQTDCFCLKEGVLTITEGSVRQITMPSFLIDEIKEYISELPFSKNTKLKYSTVPINQRLFLKNAKSTYSRILKKQIEILSLKPIQIKDFRHSHAILLIQQGCNPSTISSRMGVSTIQIIKNYADFYENKEKRVGELLNNTHYNNQKDQNTNKKFDKNGRWRNKTVSFRVSEEEDAAIEEAVRLTGLSKQDYIINKLQTKDYISAENNTAYNSLKEKVNEILKELRRLELPHGEQ